MSDVRTVQSIKRGAMVLACAGLCGLALPAGAQPQALWESASWAGTAPGGGAQTQASSGEDWFESVTRLYDIRFGGPARFAAVGVSTYPSGTPPACIPVCNALYGCARGTAGLLSESGDSESLIQNGLEGTYWRVEATSDGGFIASGHTLSRSAVAYNPTPQNPAGVSMNCWTAPGRRRVMIATKFDAAGAIEWQYAYGMMDDPNLHLPGGNGAVQERDDVGWDVIERADGGFRLVGCAVDPQHGMTPRAVVIDLDANGRVLGRRTYGISNTRSMFMAIERSGNEYVAVGTLFVGTPSPDPNGDVFVVRLSDVVAPPATSSVVLTSTPEAQDTGFDVAFSGDGTVFVSAILNCTGRGRCFSGYAGGHGDAIVWRLDRTTLNVLSSTGTALGTVKAFDVMVRLQSLSDGGVAVISTKQPNGPTDPSCTDDYNHLCYDNTDAFLAKLSASGTIEWTTIYAAQTQKPHLEDGYNKFQECLYDVAETSDGGLIIVGNNSSNLDDNYAVRFGNGPHEEELYGLTLDHQHLIYTAVPGGQTLTHYGDLVVPGSGRLDTHPGTTLRFGGYAPRLVVGGTLNATGTTFTALDPMQGWRGILLDNSPGSVLDGTQVTGVRFGPNDKTNTNAVTAVNGAALTIRNGSRVAGTVNGGGVAAVGDEEAGESTVVIEGSLTKIEFNDYAGVSAEAGAQVTVRDGAQVRFNPGGGVLSAAYGSAVSLDRGAVVSNVSTGALAVGGGLVRTTSPAVGSLQTLVNGNHGGLSAKAGGSIQMGTCTGGLGTCTNAGHQIRNNSQSGTLDDARSVGGSAVRAQGNDWGVQDVACLTTYADGSSTLLVWPIIPSGDLCDTLPGEQGRGVAAAATTFADTEPAAAARMSNAVLALVVAAEEALATGDETGAFASILSALAASESDDDDEGAFAGAARMFAVAQPPAAVAAVEAYAAGAARPWALGALAVAYARSDRPAEADAAAAALETEFAGTDHAALGLGIRARLAAGARDEARALAHLVALYDTAPESASFTTAVAVVAAAFPDVDLGAVLSAPFAGKGGLATADASATAGASPVGVAVWPNPTASSARVTVSIEAPGTLDVAVFDAVGRRVAVLADGEPVEGGVFSADVPVADLPAGVYIVRVAQHANGGPVAVSVARLTVLR